MITIESDTGIQYSNILSVDVGMSLAALVRDFTINVAQPGKQALPFKGGEQIRIWVDNELACDGFVDAVTPGYSKDGHTVALQGRSKAQDLVDSSLFPIAINTSISLVKVIELVISQIGLDLRVINQISDLEDFDPAEDKIGAASGENAFSFIDTLARKRQVLLTSNAQGDIIISRSGTSQNQVSLRNLITGDSNILSGKASYNTSKRFNKYAFISQLNTTTPGFTLDSKVASDQLAISVDTPIRARQMVMVAEKASSNGQLQPRADWQNNMAKANSRIYSVTVQGVRTQGGEIWQPNRLQAVADDFSEINEVMLIDSVRFNQTKTTGTVTSLSLVDRTAYDQQLAEPVASKDTSNGLTK